LFLSSVWRGARGWKQEGGVEEEEEERRREKVQQSQKKQSEFRRRMQADAQSLSSKFAFQETQDGRSRYRERRKKHRDAESRERKGAKDAIIPFDRHAALRRRRPEPVSAAAAALLVSEIQPGIRSPFASPPSRFSRGAARKKLKMKTRARLELEVRRQGERRGRRDGMSFFPDDASKKRGVVGVECQ